ncbi:hypothetical protein ACWGJB_15955 [Streptomyces sp. NPDC054813]
MDELTWMSARNDHSGWTAEAIPVAAVHHPRTDPERQDSARMPLPADAIDGTIATPGADLFLVTVPTCQTGAELGIYGAGGPMKSVISA